MKLLNYKQFVNEANLMYAVAKGSNVNRIEFDDPDPDAFISKEEVQKDYVIPGVDKEGKTIHDTTEVNPKVSYPISTY